MANHEDKPVVKDGRERIGSGDLEFCTALCVYLNSELTFSEVADFQVSTWTKRASYDFPFGDPAATHEVSAAGGPCRQYSTSLQRARDLKKDFKAGWEAARKGK